MASVAPPPVGGLRMEVACCDADHEGEWEGEWEECEVVADHGETCDVRIAQDGELCAGVPCRFVRVRMPDAEPRAKPPAAETAASGPHAPSPPIAAPRLRAGSRVKGNWQEGGEWYEGTIDKALPDGTFAIRFDDGDYETGVPLARIRPLPPSPHAALRSTPHSCGPTAAAAAASASAAAAFAAALSFAFAAAG